MKLLFQLEVLVFKDKDILIQNLLRQYLSLLSYVQVLFSLPCQRITLDVRGLYV